MPSFGNLTNAVVATLGLNPSNREFVNGHGEELIGDNRRLHTLRSLRISHWSEASNEHLSKIATSCYGYFLKNPYAMWFRDLEQVLNAARLSYYGPLAQACHLDLIPYATACKWTELSTRDRSNLLDAAGDTLGMLLQDSAVRVLLLNGQGVVDSLQRLTGVVFEKRAHTDWALPRRSGFGIRGYSYKEEIGRIGPIKLRRPVVVIGYNHNLQSSYGVTTTVKRAIRSWVGRSIHEVLLATT